MVSAGILIRQTDSVVGLALAHLFRPFIGSLGGASLANAVNDAAGTGGRLPYTKGMYDRADRLPGYRIVYLVTLEVFGDLGKAMAWTILALLLLAIDSKEAFWLTFVAGAFFALLILLQRYPVLIESRESWLGRLAWWAHHHTAEVKAD